MERCIFVGKMTSDPISDVKSCLLHTNIAKEFALQFSKQAIDAKVDIYVGDRKDFSIDELFTEFNSRKK